MPPNPPRRRTTQPTIMPIIIPRNIARADRVRVEIVDQDGTVTNITTDKISIHEDDVDWNEGGGHVVTLALGHTDRKFLNADGSFKWTGGEELKVYQDYDTDVDSMTDTHLVFRGKINHPFSFMDLEGNHTMIIVGRKAPELHDQRGSFTWATGTSFFDAATEVLARLSDIIDTTTFNSNLSGETGTFAASIDDTYMNILAFIFKQAGWSGHLDNDTGDTGKFRLNAFVDDGSQRNENTVAAYGNELMEVNQFGVDTNNVFTRINVKGQSAGGASQLWRARNVTLEADLWQKDKVVTDNNITNRNEAQARAGAELTQATAMPQEGTINTIGDKRLRPGEYFQVFSPNDGVIGWFKAANISRLYAETFTMTVDISRRYLKNPLNKLIAEAQRIDDLANFDNFNDMRFSLNLTFDDDTDLDQVESTLTIVGGNVTTTSEGSFTTNVITLPETVSQVDMRLENPVNIDDSRIFVSADGGTTETEIEISDQDLLTNLSQSGTQLRVRMILTGSAVSLGGLIVRAK